MTNQPFSLAPGTSAGTSRPQPRLAHDRASSSGERIAYRVDEAAQVTGLGRTTIYRLIGTGQLRSRVIGRRRLISADSLHGLFDELAA